MELVLTVLVTPVLIAAGSLGARFWGPSVGGWLIAFPVTMGPLVFFAAVTGGPPTGERAAEGALAGNLSIAGFCLAYSWLARSGLGWLPCLLGGIAGFAVASVPLLALVELPAVALFALVLAGLWLTYRAMPVPSAAFVRDATIPMDLPVRMIAGALVVLSVALLMPVVGSGAGGILSMIPVTTSVVSVFAQRSDGADAVFGIQRGLLVGLVGTAAFATTVSVAIVPAGIVAAFSLALVAVVAVQAVALMRIRRTASDVWADGGAVHRKAISPGGTCYHFVDSAFLNRIFIRKSGNQARRGRIVRSRRHRESLCSDAVERNDGGDPPPRARRGHPDGRTPEGS